jgi:hypothetical protein
MQAELTAILSKVVFSKSGAQVVLECHTTMALDAARQLSKMTDKVVSATFDDGEEELPFDEDEDIEDGQGEFALPGDEEPPPFMSEPSATVSVTIDVPVDDEDDDEDIAVID